MSLEGGKGGEGRGGEGMEGGREGEREGGRGGKTVTHSIPNYANVEEEATIVRTLNHQ